MANAVHNMVPGESSTTAGSSAHAGFVAYENATDTRLASYLSVSNCSEHDDVFDPSMYTGTGYSFVCPTNKVTQGLHTAF